VIYNGVDLEQFQPQLPKDREDSLVVYVGRIIPEKGLHVLLDAFALVARDVPGVKLNVVGSHAFAPGLTNQYIEEQKEKAIQFGDDVKFLDFLSGSELANAFSKSTVFCCPSVWQEPFGMVIAEAMACGLPVVASNVGGIPEVVRGGGGLLVPPNDPEALARGLKQVLMMSREDRAKLGATGRSMCCEKFGWSSIGERYLSVLDSLKSHSSISVEK
jgi:spore coat protein SA